jgi:hypothetical protein
VSLTKVAVNSKSHVNLRYKGTDGESLVLSITPFEAQMAQKVITEARSRDEHALPGTAGKIRLPKQVENEENLDPKQMGKELALLAQHASDPRTGSESDELLTALVNILRRNGMTHLVTSIARQHAGFVKRPRSSSRSTGTVRFTALLILGHVRSSLS